MWRTLNGNLMTPGTGAGAGAHGSSSDVTLPAAADAAATTALPTQQASVLSSTSSLTTDDPDNLPEDVGSSSGHEGWTQATHGDLDTASVPVNIKETLSAAAAAQDDASSGPQAHLLGGNGELDSDENAQAGIMASRAYQLEMLDYSLQQNVIVAMDTGSGKTQVAVLRIKAELEKAPSNKIIWFLAPTVSLCAQQCEVIKIQIPAVSTRILTGNYDVHTWGASVWSAVLSGVRIVVTTPQVLLDALDHAYITMENLALIIFDEAHNCVGKHPGGKVMLNHYHPKRLAGESIPSILGLTATPSIRSEVNDLGALETLMDARCVAPTLHRDELLKCVKKPQIFHIVHTPGNHQHTPAMNALYHVYSNLNIGEDPYIRGLRKNPTERNMRSLIKAVEKLNTYCQNQMKGFYSRAKEICSQLGPWAADRYIWMVVSRFLNKVKSSDGFFDHWLDDEKLYLADALGKIGAKEPQAPQSPDDLSEKASLLMQELLTAEEVVVGIIFVKERAMVTMVHELLLANPEIIKRYQIGTMVGTSTHSGKKKFIYEFVKGADLKALQNFRSGKINLLVATSVLEEGIDVPACNLVVCFDNPTTPKSFIQRRGRARMKDSRLVLFRNQSPSILRQWENLEAEMKTLYEDDVREFQRLEMVEESENPSDVFFIVPSTGARLDFDNAKSHLDHFCRVLSQGEFVDGRPDYIIHRDSDSSNTTLTATVLLPAFVPAQLRHHESSTHWRSEKNATKDAAFQAYLALYRAHLINDNLLPFKFEEILGVENRVSEASVRQPMNPWNLVAKNWMEPCDKWAYSMDGYDESGQLMGEYEIILPVWLNQPRPIKMFLDRNSAWELRFSEGRPIPHGDVTSLPDHTSTLLALHFAHRWKLEDRQHVIRVISKGETMAMADIGALPFNIHDEQVKRGDYLIRDNNGVPYFYRDVIASKPTIELVQHSFFEYEKAPENVLYLDLIKWTRRSDFLHPLHGDPTKEQASTKPYSQVLPLTWAVVDRIRARHAQFGMLVPTLIHELGVMLIAKELATTLLKPVEISDLDLIKEAISARSASEPVHYERLEFLGDSILKFCSSVQVSAENTDWPEGYLSLHRDRLIANSRLSRAALENELPKFILTKPFTGQRWRPLYLDEALQEEALQPNRKLSTKTLADVVEALIGASYQDGGLAKALKCISIFLDECEWQGVDAGRFVLYNAAVADELLPPVLEPLEELIGYSFRRKSLLTEAMTHASYVVDAGKRSLERLEFLGDAILDNIIVTKLHDIKPPLPHHKMHTLKTAMVNGDFIAFMTMEHNLKWIETVATEEGEVQHQDTYVHLWKFMRHASLPIGIEQKETEKRHMAIRQDILEMMAKGSSYPWALLAHLQAKKFYSDLFEALLGAVWIDSGSMAECEAVIRRFGIIDYLDRLLRDEVVVQHPKEALGKWAVTEQVTYGIDIRDGACAAGDREYLCKVMIGKRIIAEVEGGVTKEEVKTKAATEALKVLAKERGLAGRTNEVMVEV